jgi:hypothetical protein
VVSVTFTNVATGDGEVSVLTVLAADDGPDRLETLCAALFGTAHRWP